ncbi:outer membrane lipoprotein carrier protein LolA [Paenarthrobacter sp. NPDC056912]|uniref:LolA family protein n=1 Tax=Paenarthrobacter sp. NPDC056912 TaxID=3345965 RepID=UPI00366A8854
MARAKQRWLPAPLIPLALVVAVLFGSVQAGATVSLPPRTAEEILAMIARTEVRALSGTVEQTAGLGLPELPTTGPGVVPGAASAMELLTGSHTARIYVDGPFKARLQVMDQLAERDLVINGGEAWFYNSADNSATHVTAPVPSIAQLKNPPAAKGARPEAPTPEALAARFLAAIDASTEVTVGEASSVAGRSAYRLELNPRSTTTLVDSVAIDVDSETGLPLAVEVRAKGQSEPAFSLAYTELNLSTPDAALFAFTPPPGATVTEKAIPAQAVPSMPVPDSTVPAPEGKTPDQAVQPHHGVSVTGEGWASIIALPAGTAPDGFTANPQLAQLLQPVDGGRALTTSLLSVLVLDDGRVFAGMVPLDRLQSAAAAQ